MIRRLLLCALALLASTGRACAQPPDEIDTAGADIRIGALSLDPRFGLSDVGVDTNVFATTENPQRDFTATVSAGGDFWIRTGRGLLMLQGDTEYVHFDRFASERGLNSEAVATYRWRLNRFTPFAWGETGAFNKRPNEEIVMRVQHHKAGYGAGVDMRLGSRTIARMSWNDRHTTYDESAEFESHDLNTQLDQTLKTSEVAIRQRLTALTTFVITAAHERNEFDYTPARDSDSVRAHAGFELGEFALIRGVALFGYHHLRADDPVMLPEYSGLTTDVNVAYTAPTQTRIEAIVQRNLRQSPDPRTPHYTQLTWGGIVTQRLFGRWDMQVSGNRVRQDYLATSLVAARTDFSDRIGASLGYALAPQVRASLDINSVNRRSDLQPRDYRGVVGGFSMTYGY
jgi:hypothetical protein